MRKVHILVIFLMVLFLYSCDKKTLSEDDFDFISVEFGTDNHTILIHVLDHSEKINTDADIELYIYTSSELIQSSLLYTVDTFIISNGTLTFTVLFDEQVHYLDDLYISVSKSQDDRPKTLLYTLNLYELATTSSSEFAAHIKNVIDGLTISSLNVLVNFSNYTITSCEHSISCNITTDYNKVTITIHLGHVVLGDGFMTSVNGDFVDFTYQSSQKNLIIILDDPNWTQPY